MLTPHSFQLSQPRCALLFLPKNFSTLLSLSLFHSSRNPLAHPSFQKNPLPFPSRLSFLPKKNSSLPFYPGMREKLSLSLIHPFFQKTISSSFLFFLLPFTSSPFFQKEFFSPHYVASLSLFSSLSRSPFLPKNSLPFFPLLHLFFAHVQTLSLSLSLSHPFFQLSQPRCTVLLPPRPPFFPRTLASLPSLSIHPFSLSLSDDGGRDGGGGGGERAQLGGWNGWIRSVGIATRCRP